MKILTVTIQKGGVAKTTTAAALAQAAAYCGRRILAVDLDPQSNLTFALGAVSGAGSSFDLLQGEPVLDLIQETEQGVDVIPAAGDLAAITSGTGSARRLQRALEPVKEIYDLVVVDIPTAAGELVFNALQAATGVIIPTNTDAYNMQSLFQTAELVEQFRRSNPSLKVEGVLLTNYAGRTRLDRQVREMLQRQAQELRLPYLGEIRRAVAIREAALLRESLYSYAPRSKPAEDYLRVYKSITHEEA